MSTNVLKPLLVRLSLSLEALDVFQNTQKQVNPCKGLLKYLSIYIYIYIYIYLLTILWIYENDKIIIVVLFLHENSYLHAAIHTK